MKNSFYNLLYKSRIANVFNKFRSPKYCAVLAYHRVRPFAQSNPLMQEMIVEPAKFDWQMQTLRENFKVVSLSELQGMLETKRDFEENMAVVTFDDAYRDNLEHAMPILEKYDIPATIFVPTAFIESDKVFWWDLLANILKMGFGQTINVGHGGQQFRFRMYENRSLKKAFHEISKFLKTLNEDAAEDFLKKLCMQTDVDIEAAKSGCRAMLTWEDMQGMKEKIAFGAHTHTHCVSTRLSSDLLVQEIRIPKEILEQKLGQTVNQFAFPYGEKNDFSSEAEALLKQAGYAITVTMEQGLVLSNDNPFQLKRIGIGGYDAQETFLLKINGVIPWLNRLKQFFH